MLMMMMMMKKKGSKSLAVVALLLASVNCILPPSNEDRNKISLQGEKYLDKMIETAVNGVKEMKSVMHKSSEDHQKLLDVLENTKDQKEEAIHVAQEMEAKLEQEQEVCNESMRALWEECKPCLKNTCVKYYSRTCSSGSGLVGRQLEEVLNRTAPYSIWINGDNTDVLEKVGQLQRKELKNLEEKFTEISDVVDNLLAETMKVAELAHFNPPVFSFPNFLGPSRSVRSILHDPFKGFHDLFSPMMGMGNFFSSTSTFDSNLDAVPDEAGDVNEDVIITKPFGNGNMTCREIRRNSAGCIKFRDECQKCKDIQHIDCSGTKPLEGPLKEELEEALAVADRFTRQYSRLLKTFQEQMSYTSSVLDRLNKEFGWVSSLANNTKDDVFRVLKVNSTNTEGENLPGETIVSVQIFGSPPMTFSVPSDIPWSDPKFSEVVAQKALDRYKETSIVVK